MTMKAILIAAALTLAAPTAQAQSVAGLWDAQVTVGAAAVPFAFSIAQTKSGPRGNFFDGDRPANPSTRGSFANGHLQLAFESYGTTLVARLENGVLRGTYGEARYSYPFEARPHSAEAAQKGAPNLAGTWQIPVDAKNEKAWRLNLRQTGPRLYATILRIDGDTGTMSGLYRGGAFHLSHFAGERPEVLDVTPNPDGSLSLVLTDDDGDDHLNLKAFRPKVAQAQGLAAPADPTRHTTVQDPGAVFRFAAKDLQGRPVDNTDPRFKGKVVLVNMMGSWCPNCHDEAPFLAKLYETYHSKGLEIVVLDFEYPDQIKDPVRLRAFIKRYGIKYTVLLAGGLENLRAAAPQAVNLHAWPTTFFLGRDGKVKGVHVGFTSPGSGPYDVQTKAEVTRQVEQLLARKG